MLNKGEKVKNTLKIMAVIFVAILVMMAEQTVIAQELRTEVIKGIIQTMGPDVFKSAIRSAAEELAKDPQLRKQVIREVIEAIGPDRMKDIVKSPTGAVANSREVNEKSSADAGRGPSGDQMRSAPVSVGGELINGHRLINTVLSKGPVSNPQALMNTLREEHGSGHK